MKYKMIISDWDGTLFRQNKTVSKRTIEAIGRYRAAGGIFTIATGRMFASIRQFLPPLGLDLEGLPVASFQGLMINDAKSGQLLYMHEMDKGLALEILLEMEKRGIYAHTYVLDEDGVDRLYVPDEGEIARGYADFCEVEMFVAGKMSDFVKSLSPNRRIFKVLISAEGHKLPDYIKLFDKQFKGKAYFTSSHKDLVDALEFGVGKQEAVRFMCQRFGILPSEVAACGDAMNDYEMIKLAGLGCAMGNGMEQLKAGADMVLPSCEDDGVAHLIDYVLEQN